MLYNYAGRVGFPSNPALGLNHSTFEATMVKRTSAPCIYIFFSMFYVSGLLQIFCGTRFVICFLKAMANRF